MRLVSFACLPPQRKYPALDPLRRTASKGSEADVNAQDKLGLIAFHAATSDVHTHIVQVLFQHSPIQFSAQGRSGHTALHC
jgi:hypothetical protein